MAHYAFLDENNIVTHVIVGKDENEDNIDWEEFYGAKRTSYNTKNGVHLLGGEPFRKNYAGIGFTYDESRDAFIPPQPFPSWLLNEDTCDWVAPKPYPSETELFHWDEELLDWVK